MYTSTKAKSIATVERERERESYTLVTKSVVLFNSLAHTYSSKIIIKNKNKR